MNDFATKGVPDNIPEFHDAFSAWRSTIIAFFDPAPIIAAWRGVIKRDIKTQERALVNAFRFFYKSAYITR